MADKNAEKTRYKVVSRNRSHAESFFFDTEIKYMFKSKEGERSDQIKECQMLTFERKGKG